MNPIDKTNEPIAAQIDLIKKLDIKVACGQRIKEMYDGLMHRRIEKPKRA